MMQFMCTCILGTLFFLGQVQGACAADKWKVKEENLSPPSELAEPQIKLLEPRAFVIADNEGNEILTIWFRSTIPVQASPEQIQNGLTYREIPNSTLIGAIRFAKPFVDYRKQSIAASVYTLRFLIQPDVGDHMGTSPHPEFLVLCPAEKDRSAETLETKDLIKLSSASTGGDHPGVMMLMPNSDKALSSQVLDKKENLKVFCTIRELETDQGKAKLGFAITIQGHSKSR